MKNILITNDDGFDSDGLKALVESINDLARVLVVAPSSEKSACGHGLTLTKPLRFVRIREDFYKLDDGTPSDCIYLALNTLCNVKPDLIISGINIGSNMGEDVTYSGTVAGAMEGAIREIPSIAVSQVINEKKDKTHNFELAKIVIREIVAKVIKEKFPLGGRKLLNINIPNVTPREYKGIKITQLGHRLYGNDAHIHKNPRGIEYYWLGLHPLAWKEREEENSDFKAVSQGYTSITPIMLDLTSYQDIDILSGWL